MSGFVAILIGLISLAYGVLVLFANMMSDAPGMPFQGTWSLWVCWSATAGLFLWAFV